MIVVMKKGATEAHILAVQHRVRELGFKDHLSSGTERTIIGVLGDVHPGLHDEFSILDGVETVLRVSKPYKLASREVHPLDTVVKVGPLEIGNGSLVVVGGPCSVENEENILQTARAVKVAGGHMLRGGAFKPRTSPYAFQGHGEAALKMLAAAREETGLPVITELLDVRDLDLVARYADVLQIGSRNMQNFGLLAEVGAGDKPVLLKRGMWSSLEEWLLAAEYVLSHGNKDVILCERGILSYETSTRFTFDINAIPLAKRLTHLPVFGDPSHGTGKWYLVEPVAAAAVAAGADGLMIEVHPNPDQALSDGPQSLTLDNFNNLMERVRPIARAAGRPMHSTPP
jgi:3-deoxy-7-phosphoheptulonate synthase